MNQVSAGFTDNDWRAIIHRASTLYERLEWPEVSEPAPSEQRQIDARLQTWCQQCAAGDANRFAMRLAQLGHTPESIRSYLATEFSPIPSAPARNREFPSWAILLRDAIEWILQQHPTTTTVSGSTWDFLGAKDPVAFEHALAPLVEFARIRLHAASGACFQHLSENAGQLLCRHLLKLLSYAGAGPLFLEFSLFLLRRRGRRGAGSSLVHPLAPDSGDGDSNSNYLRFCGTLLHSGFADFLREYSFLGRRWATFLEFWLEATDEFLRRLDDDLPELARHFNEGRHPGVVQSVVAGISDRHNRGRTVMLVEFENGLRLVYKPKDIGLERAFFDWIHQHEVSSSTSGHRLDMKSLRTLVRPGYGWVEYADDTSCESKDQLPRFFRRSGRLLGLVFGLNGYDLHSENLVASGEHPVPVDLETLLNPDMRPPTSANPEDDHSPAPSAVRPKGEEQVFNVFSTGILPYWSRGPNQQPYDQSGLGGSQDQIAAYQVREFRQINTDRMEIAQKPFALEKAKNLPHVGNVAALPDEHVDDIVRGFEESYRFFLSLSDRPSDRSRACDCFKKLNARHVFRNTRIYATLLEQTNRVECQRAGLDASLVWDATSRAFKDLEPHDPFHAVLEAEHRALACDDIPVFHTRTNSRTLVIPGGPHVSRHFRRSGWNTLKRHLQSMNPADMERQSHVIRQCFHARNAGPLDGAAHASSNGETEFHSEILPVDGALLCEICVSIADQIVSLAFPDGTGIFIWPGLYPDGTIKRLVAGMLGVTFYEGQGGIAFFLAAMERAFPGRGYGRIARGALLPLRRELRHAGQFSDTGEKVRIGGMSGLGSLIYTFLHTGLLLKDADFVEDATRLASLITVRSIDADTDFDVLGGSAGALLALLALHQEVSRDDLLEKAVHCGKHLVIHRVPDASGLRSWPNTEGKLLAGFSHGAAGICYAFHKLFEQTGLPEFRDAGLEGLAYERRLFVPERSNWRDLRNESSEGGFSNQWCHGATGIGYSRLGMMSAPTPELEKEIAVAVELTANQTLSRLDHLCCGNAGQVSFLFDAARRMNRPDWERAAKTRLEHMLARRGPENGFRLFPTLPRHVFHPGFMQGAAGIGYALLQLERPDLDLPCCLLLE